MQLIIKNGVVIATHEDSQDVADKYPDTECVFWDGDLKETFDENGLPIKMADPRSTEQKAVAYMDKRRVTYPSIRDQLDMMYHDAVDGTTTWKTEIARVKTLYPKE